MSVHVPSVHLFCCHYTSQQLCAEGGQSAAELGFPQEVRVTRLACGGKLLVSSLLAAFEDGADVVCVVACPPDKCHNVAGSGRAARRAGAVKKALVELGVEPERIEMFHMERGLHPEFVATARAMVARAEKLGPSPFRGELS